MTMKLCKQQRASVHVGSKTSVQLAITLYHYRTNTSLRLLWAFFYYKWPAAEIRCPLNDPYTSHLGYSKAPLSSTSSCYRICPPDWTSCSTNGHSRRTGRSVLQQQSCPIIALSSLDNDNMPGLLASNQVEESTNLGHATCSRRHVLFFRFIGEVKVSSGYVINNAIRNGPMSLNKKHVYLSIT